MRVGRNAQKLMCQMAQAGGSNLSGAPVASLSIQDHQALMGSFATSLTDTARQVNDGSGRRAFASSSAGFRTEVAFECPLVKKGDGRQ